MLNNIFGICIIVAFIGKGRCLDCYNCNVSSSTYDDDACSGISSIKTCPSGRSVCLSATYEVKSGSVTTHTYMQSCFIDMGGQECYHFYKSQRDLQRTALINPITCYACRFNNCNRYENNGASIKVGFVTLFATLISLCVPRLLVYG